MLESSKRGNMSHASKVDDSTVAIAAAYGRGRPARGRGRGSGVATDHVDVDLAAAADQRVDDRAQEQPRPEAARGLADHELADVARARIGQDLVAHARARQRDRLGAKALGETQRLRDAGAILLA